MDTIQKRYAAIVEYNGTAYCGWQRQPNGVTIQQIIEEALLEFYGMAISIGGSGRTDSGVHARGQVFHFDAPARYEERSIRNALNARLPRDIALISVIEVSGDFHARFSAKRKEYVYRIYASDVRPVLDDDFCWFYPYEMDMNAMRNAAHEFTGSRDFRALTTESATREDCVRTMDYLKVTKNDRSIFIRVCGGGFLYNLVRAMAGCLAEAGRGKLSPQEIRRIMAENDRDGVPPLAPAKGLTLEWVEYEMYPQLKRTAKTNVN